MVVNRLRALFLVLSLVAASCRSSSPVPSAVKKAESEKTWGIYRFDDQLASAATVSAPNAGSAIAMAEPLAWQFKDNTVSWDLVRGRMRFKPDQLIVKEENATP